MLSGIDLFRLAGDRMRYLTARQNVIGQNIANADTPGYQARDLAPFSPSSALMAGTRTTPGAGAAPPLVMVATEPGHLSQGSGGSQGATAPARMIASSYGEKPDGNTVSLEEQMVKSADVSNAFALASAAYAKSITLIKIGIGR